jgi:hypothetical protein
MPTRELRPVIERVYWSAVASLNNESDELVDEAVTHLSDATVACPELLATLADDAIAPVPDVCCAELWPLRRERLSADSLLTQR